MPRQAVISSPAGQRMAVAAFMLSLLLAVAGLAFSAAVRPSVSVQVAGLTLAFPAEWRVVPGSDSPADRARVVLENQRRPALRTTMASIRAVDGSGQGVALDAAGQLRAWFPMMTLAGLPADAVVETRRIGGLEVAWWSGVLRAQLPMFGRPPLSVVGAAVVTDDDGRLWSIVMRDDNYRHEDPAERVVEHRQRLLDVLESLERRGRSETPS